MIVMVVRMMMEVGMVMVVGMMMEMRMAYCGGHGDGGRNGCAKIKGGLSFWAEGEGWTYKTVSLSNPSGNIGNMQSVWDSWF